MEKQRFGDFRDLEVWQKCRQIRRGIWNLCQKLPEEEKYRLKDQIIRASRSAAACIAEGYGRFHFKESIQFCRQARGSLYEWIDHVLVAAECGYISADAEENLIAEIKTAVRLLNGYIKYLKSRTNKAPSSSESTHQPLDTSTI
jgi:four helix bundle protein